MTHSADEILRRAKAHCEGLESFLLSDQVFWPQPGKRDAKSPYDLSLGQILLDQDALRAHAQGLPTAESARLEEASLEIDTVLRKWAAAAARKAGAEFPQRLNLWRAYLDDIPERRASAGEYAQQVRHRVIAERLLAMLTPPLRDQRRRLDALDESLRREFRTGAFVWDSPLAAVYPQPQYWFLYGGLRPAAAGAR